MDHDLSLDIIAKGAERAEEMAALRAERDALLDRIRDVIGCANDDWPPDEGEWSLGDELEAVATVVFQRDAAVKRAEEAEAQLAEAREAQLEAGAKSRIDERQCDAMTAEAARMAQVLRDAEAQRDKLAGLLRECLPTLRRTHSCAGTLPYTGSRCAGDRCDEHGLAPRIDAALEEIER